METANVWEYLNNVWVLAGLVFVVFAGLLKTLSGKQLDNPAVERLMHKGVNYLFILGIVGIVLGFVMPENKDTKTTEVTQTISNNSGTAINAGGDVNDNKPFSPESDRTHQERPSSVNQQIKDNSGVAINAGGNVSAHIQEK